jgi:hypothetical protein
VSVKVMSQVWEAVLPTTEKMVLLVIADHSDDDGKNAWPSIPTIARRASISDRHARRIVAELTNLGLLWVSKQAGGTKNMRDDRRPNLYAINVNALTSVSGRKELRGDIEAERGDMGVRDGVTPMSANSPIEPSNRTSIAGDDPGETEGRRVNRLTKHYADRVSMCRFPAIAQIVKMAVRAGHGDSEIIDALIRLAESNRSVTVETLRRELEGPPRRVSGSEMYARAARRLEEESAETEYRALQATGG